MRLGSSQQGTGCRSSSGGNSSRGRGLSSSSQNIGVISDISVVIFKDIALLKEISAEEGPIVTMVAEVEVFTVVADSYGNICFHTNPPLTSLSDLWASMGGAEKVAGQFRSTISDNF